MRVIEGVLLSVAFLEIEVPDGGRATVRYLFFMVRIKFPRFAKRNTESSRILLIVYCYRLNVFIYIYIDSEYLLVCLVPLFISSEIK